MFRPEFKDLVHGPFPSRYALNFQPVHEIDANIGKPAGADHLERFQRLLRTVTSAQVFQVPVIKRLNPKTDAVYAEIPDGFQLVRRIGRRDWPRWSSLNQGER